MEDQSSSTTPSDLALVHIHNHTGRACVLFVFGTLSIFSHRRILPKKHQTSSIESESDRNGELAQPFNSTTQFPLASMPFEIDSSQYMQLIHTERLTADVRHDIQLDTFAVLWSEFEVMVVEEACLDTFLLQTLSKTTRPVLNTSHCIYVLKSNTLHRAARTTMVSHPGIMRVELDAHRIETLWYKHNSDCRIDIWRILGSIVLVCIVIYLVALINVACLHINLPTI